MSEPETKETKTNYWKYSTLVLGVLSILFLLGSEKVNIDFTWLFLMLAIYLIYRYYITKSETPEFDEMVNLITKKEFERGVILDESKDNVFAEPSGKDYFLVSFIKERRTYYLFKNKIRGVSFKDMHDIQRENDNSDIKKALAKQGVQED